MWFLESLVLIMCVRMCVCMCVCVCVCLRVCMCVFVLLMYTLQCLYALDADGTLSTWHIASRKCLLRIEEEDNQVYAV